jgi:dienelactone hydrolase
VGSRATSVEQIASGLSAFSRFEDETKGRMEEQSFLSTPAGRLFATTVRPLAEQRDTAFLFCHSFAWEQYELYPLELLGARRAASDGFASMTFQARGYNDSGGDFAGVTPATHLRDAIAAAEELKRTAGVSAVVPVGVSFGSSVALRAASAIGAPAVAMWNPIQPAAFIDGLLRGSTVAGMLEDADMGGGSGGGDPAPASSPRRGFRELKSALEGGETLDVFGFPVTAAFFRECHDLDVLDASYAPATPPHVLEVVVNPATGRLADALGTTLSDRGANVRIEKADGPGRREFAASVPRGGHLATHAELFTDVVARTLAWAKETL